MLLSGLLVASVSLVGAFVLSLSGILSKDLARSPRRMEVRFHRAAVELRFEPTIANTTEYIQAHTSGKARWRLPGLLSVNDYKITFVSPTYREDLRQGYPLMGIPPHVLAKYGPPPPGCACAMCSRSSLG